MRFSPFKQSWTVLLNVMGQMTKITYMSKQRLEQLGQLPESIKVTKLASNYWEHNVRSEESDESESSNDNKLESSDNIDGNNDIRRQKVDTDI